MTKYIWDKDQDTFVPAQEYYAKRRANAGPFVISDSLDGVLNPVDGKRYDSKSKYYGAVRAAGCEIVGNEKIDACANQYQPTGISHDIRAAYEQLRNR